jgi:hypothetical protein
MGLARNNIVVVLDRLVFAQDLSLLRVVPALLGVAVLLFGCIWDSD